MKPKPVEWSKNIHWVTLTVSVPEDRSHSFWTNDRCDWEIDENSAYFEFQVVRAGGSLQDAYWRATRLAMEVI